MRTPRHISIWNYLLAAAFLMVLIVQGGCSGVRFVIDAVPATDKLTETVVMGKEEGGKDKVALIDVTGMIMDAEKPGLLSRDENPVARLVESLQKAEEDKAVKAVV